jgi:hypothetical protein
MKRLITLWLAALGLICSAMAQSTTQQPSVADVARRTQQQNAKTGARRSFTDDDLPHSGVVNAVGEPAVAHASNEKPREEAQRAGAPAPNGSKSETPAADQKKPGDEWQTKIAEQKKQVADLEHEIDLMQREYQLRVAQLYWDAGNRLRDDKKWTEDEQKYKDTLAEKNDKLQAAREKLEQTEEEARKAGAPSKD